ncbi:MAG: methylated-DNA--[protein]-cysteine S-methyltransferase [Acidimicrobiales bacterium]
MTEPLFSTSVDSPVGDLTLVASDAGLRAVLWPDDDHRVVLDVMPTPVESHPVLDRASRQLTEYFAGERCHFDIPLDLRGTDFQISVWHSLSAIPFGETSTYARQAEMLGRPTAVRAVGAANGRNPVSIVLPCHRVVGKDGSLTGFAGGLEAKRYLLDLEQGRSRLAI